MEALEILYREIGEGAAVTAPRSDVHSPTAAARDAEGPMAHYLKSMSGASPHFGTAALRFSSDIVAWRDSGGGMRREKLPMLPGQRWMGIVLLFSSANGELLAIMNDGVLQRFRVGGGNGVATRHMARQNAEIVGLIGSGWQAGTQVIAVCEARKIKKIKVFSPTKANCDNFARETSAKVGVEIVPVDSYEAAAKDVDILITTTNSRTPFLGKWALSEILHVSAMQRDEFDEALMSCRWFCTLMPRRPRSRISNATISRCAITQQYATSIGNRCPLCPTCSAAESRGARTTCRSRALSIISAWARSLPRSARKCMTRRKRKASAARSRRTGLLKMCIRERYRQSVLSLASRV